MDVRRTMAQAYNVPPVGNAGIKALVRILAGELDESHLDTALATLLGAYDGASAAGQAVIKAAQGMYGAEINAAGALIAGLPPAALDQVLQAATGARVADAPGLALKRDMMQSSAAAVLDLARAAVFHAGEHSSASLTALLGTATTTAHAIHLCGMGRKYIEQGVWAHMHDGGDTLARDLTNHSV